MSMPRVPFPTRLLFGSGSIAEGVKNTAFNTFLLFYYNNVLGVSGTMTGAAIFIALCVDAITDPLVGSISDGWHSRWGRRHPFIYTAALPMGVCFYLLFNPPTGLGQTGLFLWLTSFAIGVRLFMTFYSIPSSAMIPELTDDYDERTTLVSYRTLFGWMGGLTLLIASYQVFFVALPGGVDGRLDPTAYRGFSILCAIAVASAVLSCGFGTHWLIPSLRRPVDGARFGFARFFREARDVLRNRSYQMLVVAMVFASVAGGFNDVVGLYMYTYFWQFDTDQITLLVLAYGAGTVVAFATARRLSMGSDKRKAALGIACFAVVWGPLPVFLRLLDWIVPNGHPALLPMVAFHGFVVVTAVVALSILLASMIADVVDEHDLETGRRQEGLFVSAIAFSGKAASGIGGFVAGMALDVIAFPRGAEVGGVPPEKLFALGVVVGPVLIFFYFGMLAFLSRYEISRERFREIQTALALRRSEALEAGRAQ